MLRKRLKESGDALLTLLGHPYAVATATEPLSLLQAIENFPSQQPEHSDLSKLLRLLATHPESTRALIKELELIAYELGSV